MYLRDDAARARRAETASYQTAGRTVSAGFSRYLPLVTEGDVAPARCSAASASFEGATPDLSHVIRSNVALTGASRRRVCMSGLEARCSS